MLPWVWQIPGYIFTLTPRPLYEIEIIKKLISNDVKLEVSDVNGPEITFFPLDQLSPNKN